MNTPIVASVLTAILNRVRPPSGLLARIRWLFLLCALFNVVAVAPLLLHGEVGSPPMRVAGVLGAAVLVLWWSRGYGRHRFPIRGMLIEMVALTAVGLALQTPDEALGIIYCGLYFRALYARWRDALPLLLVFTAGYLAPTLIGPMIHLPMTEIVQQTIGFVVSTSVMTFVAAVGRSHERAAAREAALARAGVALMAATDQDQVSVVTLDSVRELLAEVSVRRTDLRLNGFPATFEVPETMTRVGTVTLTPLRVAGAPIGVLVVEGPHPLPEECASALATLTAEAGLAIANIRLTDDLRRDIAERKALESELAHRAFHDPLTELPNRALLVERLHHALARTRRSVRRPAVIFIDLDDFKVVNDSLGHRLGDDLLVMVSQRLRAAIRPGDTAARLGGDEFVVLLEDVADADEATQIVERFVTRLQAPFVMEGRELFVGASVGIALSQAEASLPDDLLREADLAMYSAKSKGKRRYEVFERSPENQPLERLALESDLRRAVERDELRLHYQPILELENGELKIFA